jgi:dipeptidyl aminopeptidase/acylaminoacyl peptidase
VSSLSHDEKLVCVRFIPASGQGSGVRVLDLWGEPIAELHDGRGRNIRPIDWSPRAGDQRLLLMHRRQDMPRPLLWSPETGAEVEIPIDLPGEVTASWYPDASALLIVHDYRGRSELYRLALGDGALGRIPAEPGWIFNSHARVRANGEVWYGQWSNAATPRQLRAGRQELLPPRGPRAPVGVPYSEHEVEGIPVFLAEPRSARPHPTIFLVHGGPAMHDSDYFRPDVQAWVDHGFAVVLVNYRGSTGYGRDWQNAIIGNPGLTELEDIAKVRHWLVAERIAEPERVILSGASWGGYLVLLGLGRQPELWSLGIAFAPVAGDYVIAYNEQMEPTKASDRFLFGGSPDEIPEVYRERSPITYVGNVQVPVMIIAGEYDPRSPIRSIEVYVERLRALGKPHQFYRWPAGHTEGEPQERVHQLEMQIEFAARSLGTRAPL